MSIPCFTQPVSADTALTGDLKQCYKYLMQKKDAYLPHEILAPLSPAALQQLKQWMIVHFLVSENKDYSLLSPAMQYNLELTDAFINAEEIKLTCTDQYVEILNGCWQMGTATIADGNNNRFVFLAADKSFVFYNTSSGVKQKDYSKSGFFFIADSCCMELHILTQWTIRNGKKTVKDADRYETLQIASIRKTDYDHAIHYFVKIGNDIYWRYSNNPDECNVE
jgi:hypothetical protein